MLILTLYRIIVNFYKKNHVLWDDLMKIGKIWINGIKSHLKTEFETENYNIFVGENNSGKSNIFFAILWFFGHVKMGEDDATHGFEDEPNITVEFIFDEDENIPDLFDEEYKIKHNTYQIKAYGIVHELKKFVGPKYELIKEGLEPKILRGKNAKIKDLVDLIFVPSIRDLNDEFKNTSSSTINKLITKFVIERVLKEEEKSRRYENVVKAINEFSDHISDGETSAFEDLKSSLKKYMIEYNDVDISFVLEPPEPADLIKDSFEAYIKTKKGKKLQIDSQGMGFQRSLIFSLICNVSDIESSSLERPTIYLIEEPELYLHPNHQNRFKNKLIELSEKENSQVLVTSHSPYFVNNIKKFSQVKRIQMEYNISVLNEINKDYISNLCAQNGILMANAKNEGRTIKWTPTEFYEEAKRIASDDELRYLLWLDPDRANTFLSKKVILVEGSTERAFFSFIFHHKEGEFYKDDRISDLTVVDFVGKFHFYKFANLLFKLGIPTWIMYDTDNDKVNKWISHKKLNEYIKLMKDYGIIVDYFKNHPDLEESLDLSKPEDNNPDISIYQKLVDNEDSCRDCDNYEEIIDFVEKIINY